MLKVYKVYIFLMHLLKKYVILQTIYKQKKLVIMNYKFNKMYAKYKF